MASEERYKTFEEFYPFYLNEHQSTDPGVSQASKKCGEEVSL